MASSSQERWGWSKALEAILVAVLLVALSPLLLVLLGWKIARAIQRWSRPAPGSEGRSASWGVFVSS